MEREFGMNFDEVEFALQGMEFGDWGSESCSWAMSTAIASLKNRKKDWLSGDIARNVCSNSGPQSLVSVAQDVDVVAGIQE